MSERRDLWVPAVLALAGAGLLAWHLVRADGHLALGIGAFLVALCAAIACLPLRIRRGQARVVQFGLGSALILVLFAPIELTPHQSIPLLITALAFLTPIRTAPVQTRMAMLAAAAVLAILSMLCMLGILPRFLTWYFVSGAFVLALQVFHSRARPEKPPPPGQRVCVYGGTFDPYHRGHRALCEAALQVNDRLLVVVAGSAPHKFLGEEGVVERTPFHHRVQMTRLGVEGLPRTEVLELEGKRAGPSYTIDTLEVLVSSFPAGTRWRLLMGADMFVDFTTWREWEKILERATLLVARRPGHVLDTPEGLEAHAERILGLEAPEVEISSTAIRERVAGGGEAGDNVQPAVRAYIRDHGLYREPPVSGS
ncbi:MAG: nicotinate (nicotinamide) nucleotide adenylyltransferase [Planctomycetota bacterium]|nr:nicotinate (nicotinamide) nucleotide adenylyltransferase [Planctomycetota bacterium]